MRPVRRADNLTTFLCAVVMKSGNLNFLEPSGPLQACNGTDLPFTFTGKMWHLDYADGGYEQYCHLGCDPV